MGLSASEGLEKSIAIPTITARKQVKGDGNKGGEPDQIPKDVPQWPAYANQISASTFRDLLMVPLCDGIRALRYFILIMYNPKGLL